MSVYSVSIRLLALFACVCYVHSECNTSQSPIPLDSGSAQPLAPLVTFDWASTKPGVSVSISNTQFSVYATYKNFDGFSSIGDSEYKVSYVEMHWGSDSSKGSEHSIDGEFFSGEIEVYLYKSDYKFYSEASINPGGLAVVSILLKEDDKLDSDVDFLDELESSLDKDENPNVIKSGSIVLLNSDDSKDMKLESLLPINKDYFIYDGSFTSIPCNNIVKRIVLKTPIRVTRELLEKLRGVLGKDRKPILNNFREPQQIGERVIYKSF